MKYTIALSAVFASVLAAAAPASSEFRLSVSDSSAAELNNQFVIFRGDKFVVSGVKTQHGVNFSGANGSLAIENGDSAYVAKDGHFSVEGTDGIPTGAVTDGFTFSGNTLQWAQGSFYACLEEQVPRYGDAPKIQAIYAPLEGVTLGDNCVKITLNKAAI